MSRRCTWPSFLEGVLVFVLLLRISHQMDESFGDDPEMLRDPNRLWTKGVVPFTYNASMDTAATREVKVAMSVYQYYTPIRFVGKNEVPPNALGHQAHADFIQGRGCYSMQGRQAGSRQEISCCERTTCIDQIGHLLGFGYGTNSGRPDDDDGPIHSYPMTSVMHELPDNFRFSELSVKQRFFYVFKELCDVYKCHEFPQCQSRSVYCYNEGFVAVVADQCTCMCLPGFDPATKCTKLMTSAPPSLGFPKGPYIVPKHGDTCPDGMTSQHLMEGLPVCQHDSWEHLHESCDWPRGTYCFMTLKPLCPACKGIHKSTLTYKTADHHWATITFCCMETDMPTNPVDFSVGVKFSLIMHNRHACQTFIGARVDERAIAFDVHSTLTDGPFTTKDEFSQYIYACDYTPVDMNCGGIIELNDHIRSTSIKADWIDASNKDCTWVIKGPEEKGALVLNFEEFHQIRKVEDSCVDSVEVKHVRLGIAGIRYCGQPVKQSIRSVYSDMSVRFQTGGNSKAKITATITWTPAKEFCYNMEDAGRSYGGDIHFTRKFQPCLQWMDALNCTHNPYSESDEFHILEANACRNPDNSLRPWCYTKVGSNDPRDTYCKRDYCDVCLLEKPYDKEDNCADLKAQGFCLYDKSLAMEKCAATCGSETKQIVEGDLLRRNQGNRNLKEERLKKNKEKRAMRSRKIQRLENKKKIGNLTFSKIRCPNPGMISNSALVDEQEFYTVGDTVTYVCTRDESLTIQRICLTTGKWSIANTACTGANADCIDVYDDCQLLVGSLTHACDIHRKIEKFCPRSCGLC